MIKVTVFFVIINLIGCQVFSTNDDTEERLAYQQTIDSIASKNIDSAYHAIRQNCDSLQSTNIAYLVDSILRADTLLIQDTLYQ